MTFGQTLQKIRRSKGRTQKQVADGILMDPGYYSRLENDRFDYYPSRETVIKITTFLECDEEETGELLAGAGRIDIEMEELARKAVERPDLRSLFLATADLPSERIRELLEVAKQESEKSDMPKE